MADVAAGQAAQAKTWEKFAEANKQAFYGAPVAPCYYEGYYPRGSYGKSSPAQRIRAGPHGGYAYLDASKRRYGSLFEEEPSQ